MRVIGRMMAVAVILLAGSAVLAQETGEKAPPKMSAEQQAMMEAWMKAATPGPQHQWLAKMAGTWSLEVKSWMDPKAPPTVSTGDATMKMTMDGRYLKEKVNGTMMGAPFQGLGFTGYDNIIKRYVSVWMDNMSTGIMRSEGAYDEATHTMTMTGTYVDPVSGKTKTMKGTSRYEGDNRVVFTYYDTTPDGTEYKSMEITYTRK
ncbi:MAG: DUF1579 domain-containing protein [Acidobacteria bacterium]|nr:DUF1579 domain-containing protein [Acidobacteriota bacterium]